MVKHFVKVTEGFMEDFPDRMTWAAIRSVKVTQDGAALR